MARFPFGLFPRSHDRDCTPATPNRERGISIMDSDPADNIPLTSSKCNWRGALSSALDALYDQRRHAFFRSGQSQSLNLSLLQSMEPPLAPILREILRLTAKKKCSPATGISMPFVASPQASLLAWPTLRLKKNIPTEFRTRNRSGNEQGRFCVPILALLKYNPPRSGTSPLELSCDMASRQSHVCFWPLPFFFPWGIDAIRRTLSLRRESIHLQRTKIPICRSRSAWTISFRE